MERKRDRLTKELKKREFTLISKSRLASTLSWEEFARDGNSACFVAYFTARCNLRSEFNIAVQHLMAADVAAWHRLSGGGLDPDTKVWNELPLPWEVISGARDCPRKLVEEVCYRHGIDPVRSGWSAPRPGRKVHAFRPTPELVHGVTVGHPGLAKVLRKLGFFSGKVVNVLPGS
jgi:hypothetical protein